MMAPEVRQAASQARRAQDTLIDLHRRYDELRERIQQRAQMCADAQTELADLEARARVLAEQGRAARAEADRLTARVMAMQAQLAHRV
jgi:chromosome segregation ATPase